MHLINGLVFVSEEKKLPLNIPVRKCGNLSLRHYTKELDGKLGTKNASRQPPHTNSREVKGDGLSKHACQNQSKLSQMTPGPLLSPQTPRDGMTAGGHRRLQQAGPLHTEPFPAKHLNRELRSVLKQLARGLLPL